MTLLTIAILLTMIATQPCAAKTSLPDSLLTINKAYTYTLTNTDTSLAIIEAMRQRKMEPEWRLNLCEGEVYINNRQMRKAIPYYEAALNDPQISDSMQMIVYKRLTDVYDLLQDHEQLTNCLYRLWHLADSQGNSHFKAVADFMSGKHLHYQGHRQQGYDLCLEALDKMKKSASNLRLNSLRAFYAELLKMYMRDGRYDEAMQMSLLEEQVAREHSPWPIQLLDNRALRRVYALRASLQAKAGHMAEADAAYALWQQTSGGNPVDDREVLDYLIIGHHSQEAFRLISRYKDFLNAQGDSITYGMLSMLYCDAQILLDLGMVDSAQLNLSTVRRISDSLHIRSSRSQMNVTYQLLEEQKSLHHRQMIISWLVALLILMTAIGIMVGYYNRLLTHRNKSFLRLLNGLDAYRNINLHSEGQGPQAEGISTDTPHVDTADADAASQPSLPVAEPGALQREPKDEDERLFVEMDRQVTRDKLFLKPDLSREDLMLLIGVDKNRFGRMISRYSEASNASVYINTKRVEYGAQLIKLHPEYTIASIAEACGLHNTVTFNRAFRRAFGLTPSEYRDSVAEIA